MLGYVVIGTLAAFGLMCAVWTVCGFFLPREQGKLTYTGPEPVEFGRRYLWLREMGLLHLPLEAGAETEEARQWLRDHEILDGGEIE